jgi:hypothetical protein
MSQFARTSVRLGLVAAAATGLVASGFGASAAPIRPAAAGSGPVLHVAITDKHLYVDGPTTFPAGQVKVSLEDAKSKGEATFAVVSLASGHTFKQFKSGLSVAFENLFAPNGNKKKGLKALNEVLSYTTGYGGLGAFKGTRNGTLLLPSVGTYVLYDDSAQLPKRPQFLHVGSPVGPQTLPTTDATVIAKTDRRFGGDTVLPANGNITFKNESSESPHFLSLQQVKNGTTRKQVIEALQSNGPGPFLRNEQDVDVVSGGQAMNVHVNLPKGTYAEMCFFPDPKTGMPHALMGMVRIVHLK